jgi:hypothetical protein
VEEIHTAVKGAHAVSLSHVVLLHMRTIPKTTSGKVKRRACVQMYHNKQHKIVAEKQFDNTDDLTEPMDVDEVVHDPQSLTIQGTSSFRDYSFCLTHFEQK